MTEIKVNGETYASVEDVQATLEKLAAQLEEMPDGAPETAALADHVGKLYGAFIENGGTSFRGEPVVSEPEPEPEADDDKPEAIAVPTTHNLREAAEGASLQCPLCGSPVDLPENPPLDPTVQRCEDCEGWGQVLTGSRVDGHVWRSCPTCNGNGFTPKPGAASSASVAVRANAAPKWESATWDADNEWWNPPPGGPPWEGARWDHYEGAWV